MSSNLITLCLLSLTLIQRSTEDDSKLKYSICKDIDFKIDSGIRLMDTNYVYLISNNTAFNLQIKSVGEAVIDFQHSLSDWSDKIQAPIDLIRTDDYPQTKNYIQLVNCDLKKEWTIKWDEDIYKAYKSSNTYDCRGAFEFLFGPRLKGARPTYLQFRYLPNSTHIEQIQVLPDMYTIRRLNTPAIVDNYIQFFSEWSDIKLLNSTTPFTKMMDSTITAGFNLDARLYLFAGKHFCSFEIDLNKFQECKIIAIKDWISNCNEELEEYNDKKSDLNVMVIILVIIIVMAFIIILVIAIVIVREIFKKKDTSSARISSSSSSRRLGKKSVDSLTSANTLATTPIDTNTPEKKTYTVRTNSGSASGSGTGSGSGSKPGLAEVQKISSESDIRSRLLSEV